MTQQLSNLSNQSSPQTHWTERSTDDFISRITFDFSNQIQEALSENDETQATLAKKLNLTEGRVSQVLNNPRSMSLKTVVRYARAIGRKVAIVLYDDDDHENASGPVNSEIFSTCWERLKKPRDFFELKTATTADNVRYIVISSMPIQRSQWTSAPCQYSLSSVHWRSLGWFSPETARPVTTGQAQAHPAVIQ